jgi:D-glycero-alpha-D-manno-heptose 1-phosphate guanylyltransferase
MSSTQEAIILAGGFGTRLREVLGDVPKPLAQVSGRPFLAWILDALQRQGLRRAILATGFKGAEIQAALGRRWHDMTLSYSHEQEPLGTGGAIAHAARKLHGDAFFVLNGDTWLTLDYVAFDEYVRQSRARFGMALARVPDVSRYGAVCVEHGRVARFIEKGKVGPGYVNAGVYRMQQSMLSAFPASTPFSFETEVLVPLASSEAIVAYEDTADFIDIGVPEDYARAQREFRSCGVGG